MDNVDKLTSLRLRYLLLILKEANVSCISKATMDLINTLFALDAADPTFLCLCTCDLLMSSADWAPTWGKLLLEHSDMNGMCDAMLHKFGLDKASLVSKCATTMTKSNCTPKQKEDGEISLDASHVDVSDQGEANASNSAFFMPFQIFPLSHVLLRSCRMFFLGHQSFEASVLHCCVAVCLSH